ncbi:hypothetical protein M378DRAFT_211877 [Amanita muscaria Koide BX008]|uniref:Uncharacterized protein n=1 Tax=Amanita muscaria (strain Koide BX008) TaxID=946122 RepID=A0A0C2XAB1_AMAMK|nr:hypothetical protein M378DRAFT_211877 [Amanita muscaria Koide BX008]
MSVRMGRSEREWLAYLLVHARIALCAVIKIRIRPYRTVAAKRRQSALSIVIDPHTHKYSLCAGIDGACTLPR